MEPIRVFDGEFLDRLCAEAAACPRRRKNHNLHGGDGDACHRFFNAFCSDSYVQPHRHAAAEKDETLVVLRGKMGVVIFDEAGTVLLARRLSPGMVADVPANTFHSWVAFEDGTVFLEAKAGPYVPVGPGERASFAPAEGEPGAAEYLAWLKSLCASN